MINSKEFTQRLQKIMEYYDESASSFADKISVQRSSISHILSGRNKPSLEFVLKIISAFPEVELYWLLKGKGVFPKQEHTSTSIDQSSTLPPQNLFSEFNTKSNTKSSPSQKIESETLNTLYNKTHSVSNSTKKIKRIVLFFEDGSFEDYKSS